MKIEFWVFNSVQLKLHITYTKAGGNTINLKGVGKRNFSLSGNIWSVNYKNAMIWENVNYCQNHLLLGIYFQGFLMSVTKMYLLPWKTFEGWSTVYFAKCPEWRLSWDWKYKSVPCKRSWRSRVSKIALRLKTYEALVNGLVFDYATSLSIF